MSKRIATYARVSSTDQADNGTSLTTQTRAMLEHANQNGLEVIESYQEDFTGYDLERPLFDKLRDLARKGRIDGILCYALDRLSRNQMHQTVIYYEMEQLGVSIELITEKLDDTPEGRLLRGVLGYTAEKEREKIIERTQRGKRERAKNGGILAAGVPIYGYKFGGKNKERYDIDDEAAETVRLIFQLSEEGKTCREIAIELNNRGILTRMAYFQTKGMGEKRKAASSWTVEMVMVILKERTYIGQKSAYQWQGIRERRKDELTGQMKLFKSVRKNPNLDEHIPLVIPALVTDEQFQKAQYNLNLRRNDRRSQSKEVGQALFRGGFARCGYCGAPMVVSSARCGRKTTTTVITYMCSTTNKKKIKVVDMESCPGGKFLLYARKFDKEVWEQLAAYIERSDDLVDAYEQMIDTKGDNEEREDSTLCSVKASLENEKRKKENYLTAIGNAINPDALQGLTEKLEQATVNIRGLEKELVRVSAVVASYHSYRDQLAKVKEYLQMARSVMNLASYEEKRVFMYAIGVQVKCYRADDIREDGTRFEISINLGGQAPTVVSTTNQVAFTKPSSRMLYAAPSMMMLPHPSPRLRATSRMSSTPDP